MTPEYGKVYEIEFEEVHEVFNFRARCICEQPLENGLYLFDCDGEEVEVMKEDIIREISIELA